MRITYHNDEMRINGRALKNCISIFLFYFSTLTENELLTKQPQFDSQSTPRTTGTLDGKYNYLPLGSRKPCLYVRSWWPMLEWRIHNSNNLRYIIDFLVCNKIILFDILSQPFPL